MGFIRQFFYAHTTALVPGCTDVKACEVRATCPYARVFEPGMARGEGPSGLRDWPRPFVFRASELDGRRVGEGEPFHFDIHMFDVRDPALAYFVLALRPTCPRRHRPATFTLWRVEKRRRPPSEGD